MEYGISTLCLIPCRKEPDDTAEMVSQVLFGEHFKIIEIRKNWSKIRTAIDCYESWIDNKQYVQISKEQYNKLDKTKGIFTSDIFNIITLKGNVNCSILIGSTLPFYKVKNIEINKIKFHFEGAIISSKKEIKKSILVENASKFLNAPYLWGGRSPFGIDCSGFTQLVYKMNGIFLPRDAFQQAEIGEGLSFIEEAEPGDLAFFDNDEGRIIHVGIVFENNCIIHASGKVRIDRLDHQGIYNIESKSYTHKLRIIKKII